MKLDEYMSDLDLIWDKMRSAGYTYIAAGMLIAFFIVWMF